VLKINDIFSKMVKKGGDKMDEISLVEWKLEKGNIGRCRLHFFFFFTFLLKCLEIGVKNIVTQIL